jgi:ketosteroid isomerase-like protein
MRIAVEPRTFTPRSQELPMTSKLVSPGSARHALILASSLILAGAASAAPRAHDDADLSALLKRQTQAFSEAGQRGDAATIELYLDRDVVFTNETGAIATKKELVEGTSPPPANAPKRRIEVTNWALRRQGDAATATFIDEVTQEFQGQTLLLRYQSTETWAKRQGGWKMIASHTMNVQSTPVAITLPPADLDAYVGTYQVDSTYVVKISRGEDGLTASANGGSPIPLNVEIKDVLFIDAAPNVRKLFQRDVAGHVVGYINRRDGTDLIFRKIA